MDDIYHNIFSYLEFGSIYNCIQVCKQYYGVICRELFWLNVYEKNYLEYVLKGGYYETCRLYRKLSNFVDDINVIKSNGENINITTGTYNYVISVTPLEKDYDELLCETRLSLENLHITYVPKELCLLVNLTHLDLANNDLTYIPKEIFTLEKLVVLILYSNKICVIPPEIGLLVNLEDLDMHHNYIVEIPTEIGLLTNLLMLGVSHNNIITIPSEIALLLNLEELYIYNTKIRVLPIEMMSMPKLEKIYIDIDIKIPIGLLNNVSVYDQFHRRVRDPLVY